jgi:hypothetical protein
MYFIAAEFNHMPGEKLVLLLKPNLWLPSSAIELRTRNTKSDWGQMELHTKIRNTSSNDPQTT